MSERNAQGLLEGVEYVKNEDGSINWRAMIPAEFIKVNKDSFKGGEIPTSTDGLPDNKLLILLGGIKWVAKARGLIRRDTKVDFAADHRAVCTVSVSFSPNFENPEGLTYSDCGAASLDNTAGFGQLFLETIAANRAFVRAVRNALGINIVGQDEVAPANRGSNQAQAEESVENVASGCKPHEVLRDKAVRYFKKKNNKTIDFAEFKDYVIEKKIAKVKPEEWGTDWDSIPGDQCFILMGKIPN